MKSEKIIPHNVYPAITTAQMGSQWRGALRTRHAIADLMKSCWYSNVTVMVLASTKLFIIRSSFPTHLGLWFEQPKCISRVKNERTFVLVNTWVSFFQNSCPWFSSWHDLFAFWQQAWQQWDYDSNFFLFFFNVVAVLFLISKTWLNPANSEWEGLWGPFVFVSELMGGAPLILWKWTGNYESGHANVHQPLWCLVAHFLWPVE